MTQFLQLIFTWTVTAAAVGACALLLTRLLRRFVSARSEYLAWVAVLLLVLLLPIKPSLTPAVTIPIAAPQAEESLYAVPDPVQFVPEKTETLPAEATAQRGYYNASQYIGLYDDTLQAEHRIAFCLTLPLALTAIYVLGVIAMLMYHLTRHVRFMRYIRRWQKPVADARIQAVYARVRKEMGLRRDLPIYICPAADSPMVAGILRPRLLLPDERLNLAELALVLRHELTHVKRCDLLTKALQMAAVCLHWFNPLVHVMNHAMNYACEASCDESVVRGADMDERQYYSETIIAVIRRQSRLRTALSTSFYGGKKGMKNRILTIMDPRVRRLGALLLIPVLLLSLFFTVAVATEPAQSTNPPDALAGSNLDKETGELVTQEKAYEIALQMLKDYDDRREFEPVNFEIRAITWMDVPVETAVVRMQLKTDPEIVKFAYFTARACAPLEITQTAGYDKNVESWRWMNTDYIKTLRKGAVWDVLPQTGYILNSYAGSANMCTATTSYDWPQGTYYNGVQVKVLETHTMMNNVHFTEDPSVTWAKVQIGAHYQSEGATGWMPLPALVHEQNVLGELPSLPTAVLKTNSDTGAVTVYTQNDRSSAVLAAVSAGTKVKLLGRLRDFYHVELENKKQGFVEIAYVQVDEACQQYVKACEPAHYDQIQPGQKEKYEEYMAKQDEFWQKYGDSNEWPLEVRAARTQLQLAYGFDCEEGNQMHILPGEGDMTEDEARKIANAYVKENFGMGAENYYKQTVYFYYFVGQEETRIWGFTYFANAGLNNCWVRLNAQTGEIIEARKLDFVSSGPDIKENTSYSKDEIGYYYDTGITISYPEEEDEAVKAAAKQTAVETFMRVYPEYGDMALYDVNVLMQHDNKGFKWYLVQIANVGEYSTVFEVVVTLEDEPRVLHTDAARYAENAKAVQKMIERAELEKTRGPFITWTLEEQHAWKPDTHGLPTDGMISADDAQYIARNALVEGGYLTEEELKGFLMFNSFYVRHDPEWRIQFYTHEAVVSGQLDGYHVLINPRTGDVIDIWGPGGNG